jgi:hypothetical protein
MHEGETAMIPEDPWFQSFLNSSQPLHQVQESFVTEIESALGLNGVGPEGGGKYAFNGDQLVAAYNKWKGLKSTVDDAVKANASTLQDTVPAPGNEQASETAVKAIGTSNQAYGQYLMSMQKYIQGYVDNLESTIKGYKGTEQSVIDAARTIQNS